jgi:23S rRNA maturation mini-RNase III
MGSIFKPSSTVVQAPSQSTTTYDIPAYFKEIQERTLRRAENCKSTTVFKLFKDNV